MKKIILAALAASMLATPALAAQHQRYQPPARTVVVHQPAPQQYRNWRKGQRFDQRYARNYQEVDYRHYRLRPPPRGYHYVRSGNDVVLVALATGIIASIFANAIR